MRKNIPIALAAVFTVLLIYESTKPEPDQAFRLLLATSASGLIGLRTDMSNLLKRKDAGSE
jgi:hypothetical protein